jgi:hypothetical protein
MAASDYTDADLTAVRRAIAKGERSVQFADRAVTYRSMEELLAAEARISGSLEAAASTTLTRRPKQTLLVSTKGF